MVITILAEPRSGSSNLTNWFYFNKDFTALFEPGNPNSKWFQNNSDPKNYNYNTKHLCIKEIYYPGINWNALLNVSDKIIVLYREGGEEQLESFLNAVTTDNWHNQYVYKRKENLLINEKTEYFNILKSEFKEKYVNKEYFTISYEELYYNNGFQRIVDYIDLPEVSNVNFPYGQKYRIEKNINKLI
jgi:hypothetical protein